MEREPQHSDTDVMVMVVVGTMALGSAGTIAVVVWQKVVSWCLAHGLLVPSSVSPMLSVPGGGGAGLDLSRILVVAAVLAAVMAVTARGVRRGLRRDEELGEADLAESVSAPAGDGDRQGRPRRVSGAP